MNTTAVFKEPQVVSEAKDNNANFAWVQHFIHHLAPGGPDTAGGIAGFVLANGSMSSSQSGGIRGQFLILTHETAVATLPAWRAS